MSADLHDFRDALRQARMRGHDLRAAHPEVILLDALLRELRRVDRLVQLLAGCEREQSRNGAVGLTTRAKPVARELARSRVREAEVRYEFSSLEKLLEDFRTDCERLGWRWSE